MTNSMTVARAALAAMLQSEFGPDGFHYVNDNLHKSLGLDGKTRIATSPVREQSMHSNRNVMEHSIKVQFYGAWNDRIDPTQVVDPAVIEGYAERFKQRLRTSDPDTNDTWYFLLEEIIYPDDPTGNRTRFEARVTAFGTNSALLETSG